MKPHAKPAVPPEAIEEDEESACRGGFKLSNIAHLDARQSVSRCLPACLGVHMGNQRAVADTWRARNGELLVRCSSGDSRRSLSVRMADGTPVPGGLGGDRAEVLDSILVEWIVDGVDDWYLLA